MESLNYLSTKMTCPTYSISTQSSLQCWKPSIIGGHNLQPNTFEMSKSCLVNYGVTTKITINACIVEAVVED